VCYYTYISTTSARDLTACGTDRIGFQPLSSHEDDVTAARLLGHEHKWFVAWMGGCSCGLRYHDPRLNPHDPQVFDEPQEWCAEDPEDIENACTGCLRVSWRTATPWTACRWTLAAKTPGGLRR